MEETTERTARDTLLDIIRSSRRPLLFAEVEERLNVMHEFHFVPDLPLRYGTGVPTRRQYVIGILTDLIRDGLVAMVDGDAYTIRG